MAPMEFVGRSREIPATFMLQGQGFRHRTTAIVAATTTAVLTFEGETR
jgi:hypothetical protein